MDSAPDGSPLPGPVLVVGEHQLRLAPLSLGQFLAVAPLLETEQGLLNSVREGSSSPDATDALGARLVVTVGLFLDLAFPGQAPPGKSWFGIVTEQANGTADGMLSAGRLISELYAYFSAAHDWAYIREEWERRASLAPGEGAGEGLADDGTDGALHALVAINLAGGPAPHVQLRWRIEAWLGYARAAQRYSSTVLDHAQTPGKKVQTDAPRPMWQGAESAAKALGIPIVRG